MNYEKKYNEALERAKKLHDSYNLMHISVDEIEQIFPELAEIEDEKIYNEIISALKFANDDGVYDEHIAYLEKQKEQNLIMAKSPQFKEQKPAEWSEEDEKIIQSLILKVNKYVFFAGIEANKIVNFLKSLPERFNLQSKQEWNTHDKAIVNCIVCCLDDQFVPEAARKQSLEWFNKHRRDFLNSPSWKPSEEQLEALSYAIQLLDDGISVKAALAGEELESLREDLKKL